MKLCSGNSLVIDNSFRTFSNNVLVCDIIVLLQFLLSPEIFMDLITATVKDEYNSYGIYNIDDVKSFHSIIVYVQFMNVYKKSIGGGVFN